MWGICLQLGWLPPSHIKRWERVVLTSIVAVAIQQPFPCCLHGNLGGPSVLRPLLLKRGSLREGPPNKVSEREGSEGGDVNKPFLWVLHCSGLDNKAGTWLSVTRV